MQVKKTNSSPTNVILSVVVDEKELSPIKAAMLSKFQGKVKVAGFRAGKVPMDVLEKNIEPSALQSEFLEEAIEQLYIAAASQNKLRPVDKPKISIKKFVPFTVLEFDATIDVLGEVKLADYKKIKVKELPVKVTEADVDEVLESLRQRVAEGKDVTRAAKNTDQVYIDFKGVDAKTKKPINGADGKDYPLVIGSKAFIPGFEEEIIGLKPGEDKTFTIIFPKDYGAKALQNKEVEFTVSVIKIQEMTLPELDDSFAAKVGPVETLETLKEDVKTQLKEEKQQQADRQYESELIKQITDKSTVEIPELLIEDQVNRLWAEMQQNIMYRGQTIEEFLESEDTTEAKYRKDILTPQAVDRVKASIVLAEIAEQEELQVTQDELDGRMQLLRQQYQDPKMQLELEKPETRQDIAARLLTEKTIDLLVGYSKK